MNCRPSSVPEYRPYPTHLLPAPLQQFVEDGAKSIGCDPSMIALPVLAVCAGLIGNTRRLRLTDDWIVPPILWGMLVVESGAKKSPAFRYATDPLKAIQHHEFERREADDAPPSRRYFVQDATIEAIAVLLCDNPRGLMYARDELNGWFGSHGGYATGRRQADCSQWLEFFNGGTLTVDRKTGERRTISVSHASVSICGTIQPEVARRAFGTEHFENGLVARFVIVSPPKTYGRAKSLAEMRSCSPNKQGYESLLEALRQLSFDGEPKHVELSPEAEAAFDSYRQDHLQEQDRLTGRLEAAWSKLEEYPARFALVFHCVKVAMGEGDEFMLDGDSMERGIELAKWHKHETRRVYAMLGETSEQRELREVADWIRSKHSGSITASELQRGRRSIKTSDEAQMTLFALREAGFGEIENRPPPPNGGHATLAFHLSSPHELKENGAKIDGH